MRLVYRPEPDRATRRSYTNRKPWVTWKTERFAAWVACRHPIVDLSPQRRVGKVADPSRRQRRVRRHRQHQSKDRR